VSVAGGSVTNFAPRIRTQGIEGVKGRADSRFGVRNSYT
jgi:hypothetical protein